MFVSVTLTVSGTLLQVWMSFAQFELRLAVDGGVAAARGVYQRASTALRQVDEKEERLMLLEVRQPACGTGAGSRSFTSLNYLLSI